MGINMNIKRNTNKVQQQAAKSAAEAHNKKKVVQEVVDTEDTFYMSDEDIESAKKSNAIPLDGSDWGVGKKVIEADTSMNDKEEPIASGVMVFDTEISSMKKSELKAYAKENGIDLGTAKTNDEIIKAIVLSLT